MIVTVLATSEVRHHLWATALVEPREGFSQPLAFLEARPSGTPTP